MRVLISALILLWVSVGCAPSHFTPSQKKIYTTVKTLEAAKQIRHTGLSVAAGFYAEGLIGEEEKTQVILAANRLQDAINKTADALSIYHRSNGAEGLQAVEARVLIYQQVYGVFMDLAMPYILKSMED